MELLSWVEAAPEGVVLISFGIGIQKLPPDLANKMATAFARLLQRVIWRLVDLPPPFVNPLFFPLYPSFLFLTPSLSRQHLLPDPPTPGHRNVRAFMSHCGLNGVYEAIYQGVPFYGDQYDIVMWVQGKGTGVHLDWRTLTEEGLYEALCTVIQQPLT
ncbi:2-hydroxyacylsphingosine 1-beta-galactosyltransferase [Acipenser ruthenus]|uniref:2-hydroxyacylsphingosine 1-beta-galactosyltransferase n=1 Tax=Acipenser ruthenus TaxID=7906 RepID=A0A444UL07_ACIRT|nr:2-hydroxyacylsphingosine 1-beta-galactosyltransferase [Acipenser ruthenus]